MQNDYIQFKKQRELGDILTDTFAFIRIHYKPLFGLVIRYAGPALLAVVLAYVYYMQATVGSFNFDPSQGGSPNMFTLNFLLAFLALMASGMAFYALLYGTIMLYIKSYLKNNGVADPEEVKAGIRSRFWSLFGLSFLVGLITVIGMAFCLLPGIYFAVVFSISYAIMIMEDRDVTNTINYCFQLIKGEWWITFATLFVMGILYYLLILVFNIPQYIYFFAKGFTSNNLISGNAADMFDWGYIALSLIGVLAQYIFYSLIVIGTAFIYFNINEKKNSTGTLEQIEALGSDEA